MSCLPSHDTLLPYSFHLILVPFIRTSRAWRSVSTHVSVLLFAHPVKESNPARQVLEARLCPAPKARKEHYSPSAFAPNTQATLS